MNRRQIAVATRSPAIALTARLADALEAVARALSTPDEAALLAAEQRLAAALGDLGGIAPVVSDERAALAGELARARAALMRCRVLGAAATGFVQVALAAQGRSGGYDRMAAPVGLELRGTGVKGRL